ncbi:MAG: DNA repair exonuclease [Clostridia bacterium]|nr:DNA repair exonuclease [Clostridia bacterium]
MKFIHTADMHFDTQFDTLAGAGNMSEIRRLEQRKIMKKIIDYCRDNSIQLLLISGDLYEHKFIRKSSINYINDLFKQIPDTKIFISPGNHDPYLQNSFYNTYKWSENVYIFKDEIEKVQIDENTNIYGFGFTDFYCHNSGIDNIVLDEPNKTNILIVHGSLDANNDEYKEYNSISSKKLKNIGFDYIALGHIHKRYDNGEKTGRVIYPGSPISMGFDELGEHGMIIGEIEKGQVKTEFIKLDEREYKEIEVDVTNMESQEEIIEEINSISYSDDLYKIILIGRRNGPINTKEILKLVENQNVIKVKDHTKLSYDIEKIIQQDDIRGKFVKNIIKRCEEESLSEEETQTAIEIGLEAL